MTAASKSARVRRNLRLRLTRRARTNGGILSLILVLTTAGFALSITFFAASSSVLDGLDEFADSHHQQAGSFVGPNTPVETGTEVERLPAVDGEGPGDSTLRVFPPREHLNQHQVVSGRDVQRDGEILLNTRFADAHGTDIGERVEVAGKSWAVVGYVSLPEYIAVKTSEMVLQPNHDSFGIGIVTRAAFDSTFKSGSYSTYAYSSSLTAGEVTERYDPASVRETEHDSRVQQAIGDAEGPRDLAVIIFVIFVAVQAALLSVYHLRIKATDGENIKVLQVLGITRGVWRYQLAETRFLLLITWVLVGFIASVFVGPAAEINGKLYDYPRLGTSWPVLVGATVAGWIVSNLVNELIARLVLMRSGADSRADSPKRVRLRMSHTPRWLGFGRRYKLVRSFRLPGEPLAVLSVVIVAALFVAFSVNLKASVDSWVDDLGPNTPYEVMYETTSLGDKPRSEPGQESARVATLSAHDTPQSLFVVPDDSTFFGHLDGPAVTAAYAEKYDTHPGDTVELKDVRGATAGSFRVTDIVTNTGSALIYLPESSWQKYLKNDTAFGTVLFSDHTDRRLEGATPATQRADVVSSGKSITEIINLQISLLLVLAGALLAALISAVVRFSLAVQRESVEVMEREGLSRRTISASLFSGMIALAVVATCFASWLAATVTRVFLDGIMGGFVHFVPVTGTWVSCAIALIGSITLLYGCIYAARRNI